MRTAVLCAVHGRSEARLVAAIDARGTGLSVARRCADLAEVIALALAGVAPVAVLSGDLPGLDRAAVARLREAGVRTVLLAEPGHEDRCRGLGAAAVVSAQAGVEDVVEAVRSCVEPAGGDDGGRAGAPTDLLPASESGDGGAPDHPDEPDAPAAPGSVIAVWGPHGAPGRTTLAVNLAAELAALGEETLLVDADTWGGACAQTLGLLDESPGLAAAARSAANGSLDVSALARLSPVAEPGLRVLTGLSRPDRWRELPPAGLDVVWETARTLARWTVVDCGFSIEDEAGAGFEAMLGPRRNGATLSALAAADVVLVVGAGEPVGIQRLVQALADLADAGLPAPGVRRVVVVNRVRASAAGPAPEQAVEAALVRYAGARDVRIVPDDRPALDRAMLAGTTLRETAPHSPARAAVAALALDLTGRSGRRRDRGGGRRSGGGRPGRASGRRGVS